MSKKKAKRDKKKNKNRGKGKEETDKEVERLRQEQAEKKQEISTRPHLVLPSEGSPISAGVKTPTIVRPTTSAGAIVVSRPAQPSNATNATPPVRVTTQKGKVAKDVWTKTTWAKEAQLSITKPKTACDGGYVVFSEKATAQLCAGLANCEVSFVTGATFEDTHFLIEELYAIEQEGGAGSTKIDPGALATAILEYNLHKKDIFCWIHTHGNMGAFWSQQDVETVEGLTLGKAPLLAIVVGISSKQVEALARYDTKQVVACLDVFLNLPIDLGFRKELKEAVGERHIESVTYGGRDSIGFHHSYGDVSSHRSTSRWSGKRYSCRECGQIGTCRSDEILCATCRKEQRQKRDDEVLGIPEETLGIPEAPVLLTEERGGAGSYDEETGRWACDKCGQYACTHREVLCEACMESLSDEEIERLHTEYYDSVFDGEETPREEVGGTRMPQLTHEGLRYQCEECGDFACVTEQEKICAGCAEVEEC